MISPSCAAKPPGDVVMEGAVDVEERVDIHPVRDYGGVVEAINDVTPNVRRLVIGLQRRLPFNPGQYVLLDVPGGEQRPYSIASSPSDGTRIELHVKRSAHGLATDCWVFKSLAVADTVSLSGPYGQFFFRPMRTQPILLLAGGTGLAPMKSIVRHIAETGAEHEVVLYHGVATQDDLYDREWFEVFAMKALIKARLCPSDIYCEDFMTCLPPG
ncbi:MAG TPA: FAD-binding oxidoreductase [Pseudonocardiaceae bacterium]|nr:FAD-binding oxidoreductase [Pseudonocardiaceae bacterium]